MLIFKYFIRNKIKNFLFLFQIIFEFDLYFKFKILLLKKNIIKFKNLEC